jgi:hypothetical protein
MSQAKISKWPNTIHAERERKEAERIRKLEDDEVSTNLLESSLFQTDTQHICYFFGGCHNFKFISYILFFLFL